jgi:LysM repeat protein
MFYKRALILLSILLVVAMLGACVRSASTPPVSVVTPPTKESSEQGAQATAGETSSETAKGQPTSTNEVLQQLAQFVTQTAAAAQMAGGQAAGGQQPGGAVQGGTPYPGAESSAAPSGSATTGQGQPTSAYPAPSGQQPSSPQPTSQQPVVQQPTSQSSGGQQPGGQQSTSQPSGGQQPGGQQPTSQPSGGQQPGGQQPTSQPPGQQPATQQPGAQVPATQPAPPQPGQLVMPTPTPGIPTSYTLQPGEFVYCIARRFNVNPFELLSINGLSTSSVVRGGTTLKIPQTGHPFPGERSLMSHPTTYIVQSGENIYEISCKFGAVSPDQIAYANHLQSPYTLTAGQQLIIP